MKIGLIDVDSHNFPNLALMKISAFYRAGGEPPEFVKPGAAYDRVYVSKIFTESKEPDIDFTANEIIRGGSGYDLNNKLPGEIEHIYPDYSLYPEYTRDTAYGWLTRGCPRINHAQSCGGFCITPDKDGCKSLKVADLSEFWDGQKKIVLYDQNILGCRDRIDLLGQLADSKASVEFNGGMDVRYLNDETTQALRKVKVKDYHFAWDDPREELKEKFLYFKESGLKNPDRVGVYVLVNFWSDLEQDLYRIYTLRKMGFCPFVMVYDKQKFFDSRGRWLPGIGKRYTREQLQQAKTCQHLQRWCNNRKLIKLLPDFNNYDPYKNWIGKGKPVPEE